MKTITFNIEIPEHIDVSEQELNEFIEFELGIRGGIPMTNPLMEYDLGVLNPCHFRMY